MQAKVNLLSFYSSHFFFSFFLNSLLFNSVYHQLISVISGEINHSWALWYKPKFNRYEGRDPGQWIAITIHSIVCVYLHMYIDRVCGTQRDITELHINCISVYLQNLNGDTIIFVNTTWHDIKLILMFGAMNVVI